MDVTQFLQGWTKMLREQTLPHGLLLCGTPEVVQGQGRDALLTRMMCQHPVQDVVPSACGQCQSCRHDTDLQSENHFRLEPQEGKQVSVNTIRQMQHVIS